MQKKSLCADDLVKETIEQYSSFVYRLAYSLVKSRSDADDIHQEVFIAFMKKRPDFASAEHERAWFIRVTVNFCKNLERSAWRRKMVSLTAFGDNWETGEKEEQDGRMVYCYEGDHSPGSSDSIVLLPAVYDSFAGSSQTDTGSIPGGRKICPRTGGFCIAGGNHQHKTGNYHAGGGD